MRVGLNLLYLIPGVVGGTETYAVGFLYALAQINHKDEFVIFVNRESAQWPLPSYPNFTRVVCPVWASSRARRYEYEQLYLPRSLKRYHIDVIHSLAYVGPFFTSCPSVVTVHDLNFRGFGSQLSIAKRIFLGIFVKGSVHQATCIITDSEFSRRQIMALVPRASARIVVSYLAPRPHSRVAGSESVASVLNRFSISGPYALAFSSTTPNKNISRLVQAFASARERHKLPHTLVLVGHRPNLDGLTSTLERLAGSIVFTGFLCEADLSVILSAAQFLVFPSIYEGFGLPVLEAMEAGIPVVCSNAAALPEVAGNAAVFFDPFGVDDMAGKIAQVAMDSSLREELRRKGFENLKRFSWEMTARAALQIYHHLAK